MFNQPSGPTLLGFDVMLVGSILAGLAAFAILMAIYAAVTIKDPMAKRVKSLNERRDELKAGIITGGTKKRASLVRKSETTDKVKDSLGKMNVLEQNQIAIVQQKLAWAGYRNKELAVIIIGLRAVLPIVFGLIGFVLFYWLDVVSVVDSPLKKLGAFSLMVFLGYKGPELYLSNQAAKRTLEIQKGLPDALDLLVICAEAGLTVDAAFNRVAKELGRAYPELGDEFALTAIELSFLNERMMRAEEKAARLPAIMTVPLIIFILPSLFIVILGPAACDISDALM